MKKEKEKEEKKEEKKETPCARQTMSAKEQAFRARHSSWGVCGLAATWDAVDENTHNIITE